MLNRIVSWVKWSESESFLCCTFFDDTLCIFPLEGIELIEEVDDHE